MSKKRWLGWLEKLVVRGALAKKHDHEWWPMEGRYWHTNIKASDMLEGCRSRMISETSIPVFRSQLDIINVIACRTHSNRNSRQQMPNC